MLNRIIFGIGNYIIKLLWWRKSINVRTIYSPTMGRNLIYSSLSEFIDHVILLFGEGRV
jgi:hypothetical protein